MNIRQLIISGGLALSIASSILSTAQAEDSPHRYIRLAELDIDPAQMAQFNAAIKEGVETAVRLEPGVLALYAVTEKDQPTRVRVFEMYTSETAYQAHLQTPHFQRFKAVTASMVKSIRLLDGVPVVLAAK